MKLGDLIKPKQYALEVLDMFLHKQCDLERTKFAYSQNEVFEAVMMSKQALEEVEQYRALGTVEELKEAREKQVAKKVQKLESKLLIADGWQYQCPQCKCAVGINQHAEEQTQEDNYCPTCGQKLDWEEGGTSD